MIFPLTKQPTVTKNDIKRLSSHIISSRRLNEMLVLDSITTDDLRRMVLIEASKAQPRIVIVRKLIGRIHSRERQRIINAIRPEKT